MNINYKLTYPTPEDYYDINVFNDNFSKVCDGIDEAKAEGYKGEVIIAAHNSKSGLKGCADFVCGTDDCTSILNSAVEKVYEGGTLKFLDGDYYLSNTLEIRKSLHIKGENKFTTTLHKTGNNTYMLRFKIKKASISNISLKYDTNNYFYALISINDEKIEIDNCYFNIPHTGNQNHVPPIIMDYNYGYTAVKNCIFEKGDIPKYIIEAEKTDLRGVISNNFVLDINSSTQIPFTINLKDNSSYNQIDFGSQKTKVYINDILLS